MIILERQRDNILDLHSKATLRKTSEPPRGKTNNVVSEQV